MAARRFVVRAKRSKCWRKTKSNGRCGQYVRLLPQLLRSRHRLSRRRSGLRRRHCRFGCDVISFAAETDRTGFQILLNQGKIDNLEKVVRFIEVKGRGSPAGPVTLEANQLKEARLRQERYFIY